MTKNQSFKPLIEKQRIVDIGRSLFKRPGKDIPAGIVVFLVALPLCLGIALASGAPLISGLISGMIGGLIIGILSKSHTSVSGPAASLSAVVLTAINILETFEVFLLALFIGGLIQVILGFLKSGMIADYMPTSIIKGLLAAIGLILVISQLPYALGVELDNSRILDYSQDFFIGVQEKISMIMASFAPGALVLSAISLLVMIFWDKTPLKKFKLLPPSLFVVIMGVLLNQLFRYFVPALYLDGVHLVSIPKISNIASFLTFPDFSAIGSFQVWTYAFTIAIVGSIASLLNLEATDNLDPHKRRSPPNQELVAQGIGNSVAGLIGGIPITSVIVRSSVNIEAGAETKLSTIIHGFLLTISVLFLSSVINLIPLASLAAILLLVGYKLTSYSIITQMFRKGWSQFIPFAVTVIAILLTDVLVGVLIGSASSVFFLLRGNFYNPFYVEETNPGNKRKTIRLELSNEVSFLNKPAIKRTLWNLPKGAKVVIDASFSSYIEPDVLEIFNDYKNTFAKENAIDFTITGLRDSYSPSNEVLVDKKEIIDRNELKTPTQVIHYLEEGNKRYVDGNLVSRRFQNKKLMDFIKDDPLAVVVNCIDMREPLNMLLNTGIGDLIPLKAAGNLLDEHLVHTLEISCREQGAILILLMGNSGNKLIKNALKNILNDPDAPLSPLLKPAVEAGYFIPGNFRKESLNSWTEAISMWNLKHSEEQILAASAYLKNQINSGKIGLSSAFLRRKNGKIDFPPLQPVKSPRISSEKSK
ncbi:bifunctional SulP family inorganic anion transporter/carbonic anhydrase [Cyclobacterium jeungdonense]|uniref:SulP family inorganic anion transporter n=1 Tax=Cyclobacterium jeungdonense TaxID=708087 RepID=A0ABT8CB77_9BACT|nr:SulP family inorganic anion transporter [Cyclobacterium jeungdonense]MDN3690064.1 SulP family inorganic anion transporter [Cyclobacterium jeungdonense]